METIIIFLTIFNESLINKKIMQKRFFFCICFLLFHKKLSQKYYSKFLFLHLSICLSVFLSSYTSSIYFSSLFLVRCQVFRNGQMSLLQDYILGVTWIGTCLFCPRNFYMNRGYESEQRHEVCSHLSHSVKWFRTLVFFCHLKLDEIELYEVWSQTKLSSSLTRVEKYLDAC